MLVAGTKLGSYEVTGTLGAGGMGEVYRARDTRLGRDVALKVLPEAFARDTERMARVRREAQMLASLNHSNIAAIYGFEDSGSTHALVMELAEGSTLAERIKQGAMPVEEALPIAKQICEAVESAHERGIVHRDLKPSNVKVTEGGAVKVLDFGLAKAIEGDVSAASVENSPTLSAAATRAGFLLGTAAYMSPEQARGRNADRRGDIWAFGVVLFEMLAGKRLFTGETTSDTLAAVIRADPEWAELPGTVPPRIRELLQRCLKKDSRQRLQSIGDARIAIEEAISGAAQYETLSAGGIKPPLQKRLVPWAVAIAAIIIAALFATGYFVRAPQHQEVPLMVSVVPPAGVLSDTSGRVGPPQFSPDGRSLAFIGCKSASASLSVTGSKLCSVWVRSLQSGYAYEIAGTSSAYSPFWSHDGQNIAFFADGKLKRVPVDGGPVQVICDAEDARGGSWGSSGTIIFAATRGSPIFRVAADGGTPVAITRSAPASNLSQVGSHRWPHFLPDGEHFLYSASPNGSCGDGAAVHFASLSGKQDISLIRTCGSAAFAAGQLIYWRDGNVVGQPFDPQRGVLSGKAIPIAGHVALEFLFNLAEFSASPDGKLVYLSGEQPTSAQLVWYDRSGRTLGTLGENDQYDSVAISKDGSRVAADVEHMSQISMRVLDARGNRTLTTFGSGEFPAWSADSQKIYFTSSANGPYDIFMNAADGSGEKQEVVKFGKGESGAAFLAASPDGKYLAYVTSDSAAKLAIYTIPLTGDRKPHLFLHSSGSDSAPAFSPDGKWLAYESSQTGRNEIYITPFPSGGAQHQVSTNGGERPVWRRDGKEIFYRENARLMLMAAEVNVQGSTVQIGAPKDLFQLAVSNLCCRWFDVTPDGHFLVNSILRTTPEQNFELVVNWPALLKKQ